MLINYLKIAWRNLTKHVTYSVINISGLTVGIACCLLIALYVREELSYDDFHEHADRIVAIGVDGSFFGKMLVTAYPLADAMEQEIPSVEAVARTKTSQPLRLSVDRENFIEVESAQYADSDFFNIFSFPLTYGNKAKALSEPGQIVLTQGESKKLFGDENPVGESLYWQQQDTVVLVQVSGIMENPPHNSSLSFGALISMNSLPEGQRNPDAWRSYSFKTYALLSTPEAKFELPDYLSSLQDKYYERSSSEHFFMPFTSLHLSDLSNNTGFTGNAKYIYLFGSVALFILIIACVNYVNLATARVSIRSKEVGIRKSMGANRGQVAGQFLGESILLSIIAYVLSLAVISWVIPIFNNIFGTNLNWAESFEFLLLLLSGAILVGILAGAYPALFLSGFSPVSILRNRLPSGSSDSLLRKGLVVFQFSIALILIIGSMVIYKQLQFTQTKDLGFNGEQVVLVDLPTREMWNIRKTFLNNIVTAPGIVEASSASSAPGSFNIGMGEKPEDLSPGTRSDVKQIMIAPAIVDPEYLDLLDIKLLAGRNFKAEYSTDLERGFIINEKLAGMLGWTPEEAIGKPFNMDKEGEVIGVVENFHIKSLHEEVEPVVLQLHESKSWYTNGYLLARLKPDQITATMDFIEAEMKKFAPYQPFEFEFLDEKFDAMYRTEQRLGQVTAMFTFITIIIACLGLYGLAAFSAERRTKEIGIRKILGASISSILKLLSKDFIILVLIGFLIAVPIAWYAMNQWLADFAYRVDVGAWVFVLALVGALVISIITVSWHSLRAATANPVESLRSE